MKSDLFICPKCKEFFTNFLKIVKHSCKSVEGEK